jgi:hydrogenase nickel incorporation protein HypA/HybF
MHEMGLAEGILAVAREAGNGSKIRRIQLQVGKLHQVVEDSLQFSFQLIANDTEASGAALDLRETPIVMMCKHCNVKSQFDMPPFSCTQCGMFDLDIVSGDEFLVNEVELEDGQILRRSMEVHEDESVPHSHD